MDSVVAPSPSHPNAPLPLNGAHHRSRGMPQSVDCELVYELQGPCDFVFMVHAAQHPDQHVLDESLAITPGIAGRVFVAGPAGNRVLRLRAGAGPLSLRYRAHVLRRRGADDPRAAELPIHALPDAALPYLLPSRYCGSDQLGTAARKLFGEWPPGHSRVRAICAWLRDNVDYRIGSTTATTTAQDVFVQRAGVCRDFAHLAVAFCRALNVPARLVCGYARFDDPPPDFHAIFEAYLGSRWVLFDPTGMVPVGDLIRVATGLDANDVAFATIFGPARMVSMSPKVEAVAATSGVQLAS